MLKPKLLPPSKIKVLSPFRWRKYRGPELDVPVIGVDEVGRGCLAGPVYAAACLLNSNRHLKHITDSKLVSEIRREEIAPLIHRDHSVSVAFATLQEIDELNILWASMLAMRRAVEDLTRRLGLSSAVVLVDGHMRIPHLEICFLQVPVVQGDLRAAPIGAASIVAKVARDQRMKELGKEYPGYGFEKHKGYACPEHRRALKKLGPCPEHRRAFTGVKEHFELSVGP